MPTEKQNPVDGNPDCYVQLTNGRVPHFKSKGLKFGHINIRSIPNKIDQFRHMCTNVFDVISVNETWCDNTVSDSEIELPGFTLLRRDRCRNGGGIALYVKNGIDFKRRDDLCDKSLECIWIELIPVNRRPIFVCAVYNPNGKDVEFPNKLLCMLSEVSICDNEMVLMGDFNCDFLPEVSSKEVNDLKFVCDLHQLQQQIRLPTRVTDHSKTLIDLFFTSHPELYVDCGVIQTAISDHYMYYAIRQSNPVKSVNNTIDYRSYKNFNEECFLNDLFDVPWINVKKCHNVNNALRVWQYMFNNVVNKHIPKKTKRIRSSPSPWLNNTIMKQMSRRDYLHRKAVRSNIVSDWNAYKLCRNKVTSMIRECKKRHFEKTISDCSGDSGKLWKTLNTILPQKRSVNPSSLDINGKTVENDNDICNGFNEHFVNVARKLIDDNASTSVNTSCTSNDDFNVHDDHGNSNVTNSDLHLPHVSIDFVTNEILGMCSDKATGLDDVSVRILKLARPAIVDSLTYIMNLSLQTGVFPMEWKVAKVVPLHKGGSLNDANNYRPISILACASKILERAVHNHMYSFLVENHLLNANQSGFRPHHSTETCLTDIVDNWLCNMNEGKLDWCCFY